MQIHIRWMIRRDMPEVLAIENGCFPYPWNEDNFIQCLRQRNCIGMVAEHQEQVVGFMIYELHETQLSILNFATHLDFRRRGVATSMVEKLKGKLSEQRRRRIRLAICEENLPAQLFFKEQGFVATHVERNFYEDVDRDAYFFEFDHRGQTIPNLVRAFQQRMSFNASPSTQAN